MFKQRIKEFNLEELSPPVVTMADQRTMAQLLQAPTEGYEDAIIVPAITADNFELKHCLLTLVQNKQFFRHDKEDPHAHIRYFNKITSTLKFPNVSNKSIKLMLFLFSLEGAAQIWLEKEPPRSIFTWDDLVSKFINQFFPPSKTTNLRNEITNFQQRFDESFSEAWDRFKDLLRAYQDSLNYAVGGNFLDKMPRECLAIIESKSKVCYSRNKPVVAKVSMNTSTSGISPDVAELKDMVKALLINKKSQNQAPATMKAVEESCVTCGGAHSYRNFPDTDGNVYRDNIQEFVYQAFAVNYNQGNTSYRPSMMSNQIRPPGFPPSSGTLPSNTISNPRSDLKAITTQSGVSYDGPQIPPPPSFLPKVVENKPEATKEMVTPLNNGSTEDVQPPVVPTESPILTFEPVNFQSLSLLLLQMAECLALADLDASINLMPLSVWNKLSLPDFSPTCMTLKLADRLISHPVGVAEDVFVKVGELTLRVGKEAITFNLDQTSRYSSNYNDMTAKRIDVIDMACEEYSQETSRYSSNYNDMTAKRIDVIDMACEEYSQEVLGFSNVIASGNPTPYYDPIVSTTSPTLTPFGNSDFLLEKVDTFLALEDDLLKMRNNYL
nr:reverse transcriptase domain-containing protein [Tanacetum cinerariifolium]